MTEIIVGVDESEDAAAALRWAVREGGRRAALVRAVLVWDLLGQHHVEGGDAFDPAYDQTAAERALAGAVVHAVGDDAAAEVARTAVCDRPAYGLIEQAAGADLLVVGGRGRGGFAGLLLGSVSGQVLHHAPCPVAVVRAAGETRAGADSGPGRVVVGVDGSAASRRALHWALEAARSSGADLEVLHAWHPAGLDRARAEQAAQRLIDEAIAAVDDDTDDPGSDGARSSDAADRDDVAVRRALVSGGAAEALLHAADGAALVVLGARGRGGFRRLLLGSVSQQVAHHATCPVVVVPPADDDAGGPRSVE